MPVVGVGKTVAVGVVVGLGAVGGAVVGEVEVGGAEAVAVCVGVVVVGWAVDVGGVVVAAVDVAVEEQPAASTLIKISSMTAPNSHLFVKLDNSFLLFSDHFVLSLSIITSPL
jgi:hypothetical protein